MGVRHTSKELERERERMRAVYAAMTDAKFEEVANDADSLTEVGEQLYALECYGEGWRRQRKRIRKWAKRNLQLRNRRLLGGIGIDT